MNPSILAVGALSAGWLAVAAPQVEPVAADMARAAQAWLESLDAAQRQQATFDLQDAERYNWHYFPKDRRGVPLKQMTAEQRQRALTLLAAGLSAKGYAKATNIMSLEAVLHAIEGGRSRFARDPELYYFSIFGRPGTDALWGWRVEGHHLSINFTLAGGRWFSGTPSFMGSNPAEVRSGPRRGLRVLSAEEDLGRSLVLSLDERQRRQAVISQKAPPEILTGAQRKVRPLDPVGILRKDLTPPQRQQLERLIRTYLDRHRPELAAVDWEKIQKAGLDKIRFAWAGGFERGQGHYYRVQGPTFLLEYDNTQNNANHIHTVWRDFENDFGEDVLRRHYERAHRQSLQPEAGL